VGVFNVDIITISLFIFLFVVFTFLGFYGARWRKGDLNLLHEWGLAGRRLGTLLAFLLVGADLYTAYTFVAIPSLYYGSGALGFYAVPYVAMTFGIALLTMPRLWIVSRNRGYVTVADFIKDRLNSKSLSILVAIVGSIAELPYIALQIVGMSAVLFVILYGLGFTSNLSLINDVSLTVAFLILAAFTFTSGLRGATLSAVLKDVLIFLTVIVSIIVIPISIGGFNNAFSAIASVKGSALTYETLNPKIATAFLSLALGSSFALYLYPHSINGSLSAESEKKLKLSISLLPLYGVGLALLALFGILIYAVPQAFNLVKLTNNGQLVVPSLIASTLPDWFVGIALLGIFIGGMVPAAIMAIAVANLLTRNVIKEFRPNMNPRRETSLAKWISAIFKFLALAFVFIVPATYAVQLQLLGGIIITQLLPVTFISLYTNKIEPRSALAGAIIGLISGITLTLIANNFGPLTTSVYPTPIGSIYIALIALSINLVVTFVGTAIALASGWRPAMKVKEEELTKVVS